MERPENTVYIMVNKSLKMSKGKIASQAAHGALRIDPALHDRITMVVVWVSNADEIMSITSEAVLRGFSSHVVIDHGPTTEVPPGSVTVGVVGPAPSIELKTFDAVKKLRLI